MIIDLNAYFMGLILPVVLLLELLVGRWLPNPIFSWSDYIDLDEARGPDRDNRDHGFVFALLTWLVVATLFYDWLFQQSFIAFALVGVANLVFVGSLGIRWFQLSRVMNEIEKLDGEKLILHLVLAKKIDSSIGVGGQITVDPDVIKTSDRITELNTRIDGLKARMKVLMAIHSPK